MHSDGLEKKAWAKRIENDMVVVCTAEILHQCLIRSFVKMEQINLLIFDEAHHAKSNHPYAR
jgi:endoribonuclease Dicer